MSETKYMVLQLELKFADGGRLNNPSRDGKSWGEGGLKITSLCGEYE